MDLQPLIPWVVAVIAVCVFVLAVCIGNQRTISTATGISNLGLALAVTAVGLAFGLGLRLTVGLVIDPGNWVRAIGNLIRQI